MLKRNKRVFLWVFLSVFLLAVPCLAKDNEAVDETLSREEQKTSKDKQTKATQDLKETKSFKRLELAYESLWITNAESRIRFFDLVNSTTIKFNLSPRSRLDIYKGLFRITPRIYIEGSYGSGDIQRGAPARLEIISVGWLDGSLSGDEERMWNSVLGFNLYKHARTNLAIDIFGGYTYFRSKITGLEIPGTLNCTFWRTYEGPYFGLKLNAPFTIAKFPNKPFALKLKVGYGPRMTIKNRESLVGLLDSDISHSGKGYYIEAQAGLSWKIFKNFFLEAAYNYFRFKQKDGSQGIAASSFGNPAILNMQNNSLTMHGPSAQVRYEF